MEKYSPDPFFGHEIKVSQPENGYRFSMDPFILAGHIQPGGAKKIVDIGCGCAIIPLILAFRYPDISIIGVEIQKELAEFARQNIIANKLESTLWILHENIKDIKLLDINGPADIIVSNPPYIKKNCGRLNPDTQKAIARHEITLDIDMLFNSSDRLLSEKGKLYIIFPAERLSDLYNAMEHYNFSPDFFRYIYTKKNYPPRRVILCAVKNTDKSCVERPPLFIYASDHKFSDEYASFFNQV